MEKYQVYSNRLKYILTFPSVHTLFFQLYQEGNRFFNVMTFTAPFLLTVPFFSFKHMSNFYRRINFIQNNILHSFSRARISIPYLVGQSVGSLVNNWQVPKLLLMVFTSALITKYFNNLLFYHHCTYARDQCKRVSCLVLFFHPLPPYHNFTFFFKQSDTFIENVHFKLES